MAQLTIHLMPSMREIKSYFGDWLISKKLWPPRSPDLTSPNFFLWGLLKGHVYSNKPRTSDALKDEIRRELDAITDVTLPDVFATLHTRIQKCLDAEGAIFSRCSRKTLFLNIQGKYMLIFRGNHIKIKKKKVIE
jgi:hypothetical protein